MSQRNHLAQNDWWLITGRGYWGIIYIVSTLSEVNFARLSGQKSALRISIWKYTMKRKIGPCNDSEWVRYYYVSCESMKLLTFNVCTRVYCNVEWCKYIVKITRQGIRVRTHSVDVRRSNSNTSVQFHHTYNLRLNKLDKEPVSKRYQVRIVKILYCFQPELLTSARVACGPIECTYRLFIQICRAYLFETGNKQRGILFNISN